MSSAAQHTILIRNAAAIMTGARPLDGFPTRISGPDIRIRGEIIEAIGQLSPLPNEKIIDATDCVVYPAWVNTHHHLFQSLLKGDPLGINASLTEWLATTPYRFRASFNEQRFRLAVRLGMIELIRSGCTTIADHNYVYYPQMSFDSSAILFEEAEKLGIRFVLLRGGATQTRQLEADLPSALRPETIDSFISDIERLTTQYQTHPHVRCSASSWHQRPYCIVFRLTRCAKPRRQLVGLVYACIAICQKPLVIRIALIRCTKSLLLPSAASMIGWDLMSGMPIW